MNNFKVEVVKTEDAARMLGTTPAILSAMIENGTVPIGGVAVGKQRRTIVLKNRLDAWINARDLIKS